LRGEIEKLLFDFGDRRLGGHRPDVSGLFPIFLG